MSELTRPQVETALKMLQHNPSRSASIGWVRTLLAHDEALRLERDRMLEWVRSLKRRCRGNGSGDGISEVIVQESDIDSILLVK